MGLTQVLQSGVNSYAIEWEDHLGIGNHHSIFVLPELSYALWSVSVGLWVEIGLT